MRKIIFLLFVVHSSLLIEPLFAQTYEELYSRANINYEGQNFGEAIKLYEEILNAGRESVQVYYNLGNSFFKLKKIGKAILNYERALRLSPRGSDIKSNLKLARSLAVDKIEATQRGFVLDLLFYLYDNLNIDELTVVVSIIFLGILVLVLLSIYLVEARRKIFSFAIILVSLLVFISIFLIVKIGLQVFTKEAVIVVEKIDVRSGPGKDYSLQFTLHEGTKLKIVNEREDWFEIDLSKDLKGWLSKEAVEII